MRAFVLVLILASLAVSASDRVPTTIVNLPLETAGAQDLRWTDDNEILITCGKGGLWRVSLRDLQPVRVGGFDSTEVFASRLAHSDQYTAVASPFFEIAWRPSDGSAMEYSTKKSFYDLHFIADMDLFQDQLVWIGATREEKSPILCTDGAILWQASLGKNLADKRPVHYSFDGPGAGSMNYCGMFEVSVVRYLPDGSFVAVPGVEPGVLLFSKTGVVEQTWTNRELNLDLDCDLDEQSVALFDADWKLRHTHWLNRRRIVDDVVPLPNGIGLIVRTRDEGRVSWELLTLIPGASTQTRTLPIEDESAFAHVRADTRGSKIAFLLFRYADEPEPSSIIVMEIDK